MTLSSLADSEVAMQAAFKLFVERAAENTFSAPNANRFFVQSLDDSCSKAVFSVGSSGLIKTELAEEFTPVAKVLSSVVVDASWLRELVKVIEEILPRETGSKIG